MTILLWCIVGLFMLCLAGALAALHRYGGSDFEIIVSHVTPAVNIRGRWFKLGPADIRAIEFLQQLAHEINAADKQIGPPMRLLRLRSEFRRTIATRPVLGLFHALQTAPPAVQQIAVWLMGRCYDPYVAPEVFAWSRGKKRPLRKEGVRALRRLEAEGALAWFARNDGDPAIKFLAGSHRPRPFAQRLARYRGVEPEELQHATPGPKSQMEFVSHVASLERHPPKARDYIRRILLHIRALLSGTRDTGGTNHISP